MSYLSRAEAIIQDEVGEEAFNDRQQNQMAAFKVLFFTHFCYLPEQCNRWPPRQSRDAPIGPFR